MAGTLTHTVIACVNANDRNVNVLNIDSLLIEKVCDKLIVNYVQLSW